jgi:hypothetical protein
MRVLIADDQTAVREGLTALLQTMPGIEVVGAPTIREDDGTPGLRSLGVVVECWGEVVQLKAFARLVSVQRVFLVGHHRGATSRYSRIY